MKHKHHNPPRHRVGNHNNIVEITPTCHAMFHFCEWQLHGLKGDYIAWRALSKQINVLQISEEVELMRRQKISLAHKGHSRKHTQSTKDKISKTKTGVAVNRDHKAAGVSISKAKKGVPQTEEHKKSLTNSHGKERTYMGVTYQTLAEAVRQTGIPRTTLLRKINTGVGTLNL